MRAVGGAQLQRHHAGRLQPWLAKALDQSQQAHTGLVTTLRVLFCFQQPLYQGAGGYADAVASVNQTFWRPL
jgi:hypothetical protein